MTTRQSLAVIARVNEVLADLWLLAFTYPAAAGLHRDLRAIRQRCEQDLLGHLMGAA